MKTEASRNTSKSRNQPQPRLSRRKFIQAGGAAATAFTILPRHVLGGQGFVPPSEKCFKPLAKGNRPPLDLFWYDGSLKPPTPEELERDHMELPVEGMMFVGDSGSIPPISPNRLTLGMGVSTVRRASLGATNSVQKFVPTGLRGFDVRPCAESARRFDLVSLGEADSRDKGLSDAR
jgi:hypothetical protein